MTVKVLQRCRNGLTAQNHLPHAHQAGQALGGGGCVSMVSYDDWLEVPACLNESG